ncbi:MAG: S8 family serine peptidase [Bacteroidales bacterium]|nr:S8 family serine peptidase [Bacteroidales bacterium]
MLKKDCPHILVSLLLILTGCTASGLKINESAPVPQDSRETISGEAILLLTEEAADGFGSAPHTKALDAIGVGRIERIFPDAGEFEERHRAAGLHRWYRVTYDPAVSRTKAGDDLRGIPGVEDVSFPIPVKRMSFNDPYLHYQWNYINIGRFDGFKFGADINIEPVWERYTAGTGDVVVAVIDGGVDQAHEDLAGVVLSTSEGSRSFVYGYPETKIFADDHGTHVAGTIAAVNNNGIGVCGVAGGRNGKGGARIMTLPMFGPRESDSGNDAAAMVWAADHGAVIMNCSWGYVCDTESEARQVHEQFSSSPSALRSAIDYFIANAGKDTQGRQTGLMAGGVVFFASGNDGYRYGAPASYEPVVAVGAFGPDGKMPRFSNYGEWVDLLAPGGSDSDHADEWILSTTPPDNYSYMSGTSMACPHVSGVAALLVSYFGGQGFTNDMLKSALLMGADPDGIDRQGRPAGNKLDALGAFEYMQGELNEDPGKISFTSRYTGDWRFKSHERRKLQIRIVGNSRLKLPVKVETDCPGLTYSSSLASVDVELNALKAESGDYTLTIRVGDKIKKVYPFTILPNNAPQQVTPMEDFIVNANSAAAFSIDLDKYFLDPDGETLDYTVHVSGAPIITTEIKEHLLTINPGGYGLATVEIQASDARKAFCTATLQVLGRDRYRAWDIFPNPVTDWLHVRPGSLKNIAVRLVNLSGVCVYEHSTAAGPFQPLDIDMQDLPGGVYSLNVNGETFTIVKK